MNIHTRKYLIDGPVGKIELALDLPDALRTDTEGDTPASAPSAGGAAVPVGIAFVAHPHPLYGGTLDNKVAQTLARAFVQLGYVTYRANFRGVGQTEGEHDRGIGEQDDVLAIIEHMRADPAHRDLPLALGGFSFGAFVAARVAQRLQAGEGGGAAQRLVVVGTPAGRWEVPPVPADSIVIHGEKDETIPLADVMTWAEPQDLPVIVIPAADHFFHRKLALIKRVVTESWRV
ncbi:MAG: alpha/beta hydrolase [Janthinobacterium lividum]